MSNTDENETPEEARALEGDQKVKPKRKKIVKKTGPGSGRQPRAVEQHLRAKEKQQAKSALSYCIDGAVTVIAIEKERALRDALKKSQEHLESKGEMRLSKKIGKHNVERIPDEVLNNIDLNKLRHTLTDMSKLIRESIRAYQPLSQTMTREEKEELKEAKSDADMGDIFK